MVRFQADADLNQIIVAALVRSNPAVDFRTAAVSSLKGAGVDRRPGAAPHRIGDVAEDWTHRICYLPL
jgi:hypothetical protein